MIISYPNKLAVLSVRMINPGIFLTFSGPQCEPGIAEFADERTGKMPKVLVGCKIRYDPVQDDPDRKECTSQQQKMC